MTEFAKSTESVRSGGPESAPPPKKRRAYQAPIVTEVVLDTSDVMLNPCGRNVVSTPPCDPPIHSLMPIR